MRPRDFTILDRNPLEVDSHELRNIKVLGTVMFPAGALRKD
jgi:predicted amidohydrolase YtcJ